MRGVFVVIDVELVVFVEANDAVLLGDDDEDLDPVPERVLVIEAVIVLVEVLVGVTKRVGSEDRVDVVVFVDVFEAVDEREGIIPTASRCLDWALNSIE